MARKRKSSETSNPLDDSQRAKFPLKFASSGRRSKDLDNDWKSLCERTKLGLESATAANTHLHDDSNAAHQIIKLYRFLWWSNEAGLRKAETEFIQDLNADRIRPPSNTGKMDHLRQKFMAARDEKLAAATPETRRTLESRQLLGESSPSSSQESPTRSAGEGLGRYFGVSKSIPPHEDLKPIHTPPLFAKPALPPPKPEAASTTVSLNTSFASDATRSFNNGSFWSDHHPPASSQDTDITEPSREASPASSKRSSEFSSLTPSVIMEVIELAEQVTSSQGSNSSEHTVRPKDMLQSVASSGNLRQEAKRTCRESQSTDYGSSVDAEDIEVLERNVDALETKPMFSSNPPRSVSKTFPPPNAALEPVSSKTLNTRSDRATDFPSKLDNRVDLDALRGDQTTGTNPPGQLLERDAPNVADDASNCQELFASMIPTSLHQLPFEVQYEAQIAMQLGQISSEELENELKLPTLQSLHKILGRCPAPPSTPLKEFEVLTRHARLQWARPKAGLPLDVTVLPVRRETSCSLQRHLGSDRVLYVEVPDINRPPQHFKGRNIKKNFLDWLRKPHDFLGQRWYPFFLQPNKKKSSHSDKATGVAAKDKSASALHHVILVSPRHGESICDNINYYLPVISNGKQSARKAYMRLELALSRTVVVATLRPDEISLVADQIGTDDPDDRQYEDPRLHHEFCEPPQPMVMNDGCNEFASWIPSQYSKIAGLPRIPPCLQIRVAGAKGLWYISDDNFRGVGEKPKGPLIKISKSQKKVIRESFEGCDEETLAVGVVKHNPIAKPSILYLQFLPILLNRGVPREIIWDIVNTQAHSEAVEFLEALEAEESLRLRHWMHKHKELHESKTREQGIETVAGFPKVNEEKIIRMLESGFDPKRCKFLAREVTMMAKNYFELQKKNFKIRLPKSSTLFGISDPTGSLAPGEVSVVFGKPFDDTETGESWWFLDGKEGLVCRNPALGPWDIQKVRFVFRPELAHFTNLIVFSSKGMRPLADKLQGGDYDGDTYWFTWEEKLVKPFKNAPAPCDSPAPEVFGINRDESLLSEHIQDERSESQIMAWLANMAAKRMNANMLGSVTLYLERFNYAKGTIDTKESRMLIHLHNHLVDSDKQGYDFDQAAFDAWRKTNGLPGSLPAPRYWKYTRGEDEGSKENEKPYYLVNQSHVQGDIVDEMYFRVLEPIIEALLDRTREMLEEAAPYDGDLAKFFKTTLDNEPKGSEVRAELLHLKDKLKAIRDAWLASINDKTFHELVKELRKMYEDIQPENPRNPRIQGWLDRPGQGYNTWDKLKASCFARYQYHGRDKPGQLIFNVAGNELCHLKLDELGHGRRTILQLSYNALTMRKVKRIQVSDNLNDSDDPDEVLEGAGYS